MPPGPYSIRKEPIRSPDSRPIRRDSFLALVKGGGTGLGEVLVYDWKNDVTVTLTRPGKPGGFPVWSPDGRHLAMRREQHSFGLGSISPDGRFTWRSRNRVPKLSWTYGWRSWISASPISRVVGTRGNDLFPAFSPDGKWLAYFSDESGRFEVYVRPFPGPGAAPKHLGKWGRLPGMVEQRP